MSVLRGRGEHRFERRGVLLPPDGFAELITVSLGPVGPVALWSRPADRDDIKGRNEVPGFASFALSRTSTAPTVALARYSQGALEPHQVVVLEGLPIAHPKVQPLSDGSYLVVGARCRWSPEGPEQNAMVVDPTGHIGATGTLGDGIESVLVDGGGDLWVGYFDEGIFGTNGWGWHGPGPEPLGASGIVRWSSRFEKVWEYEAVDDYHLADCYALNVAADRTWACPYTDFPVLEIQSGRAKVRPTAGVKGPRGLVVADEHVAMLGAYGNSSSLLVGQLSGLDKLTPSRIGLPNGADVPPGRLICRGSVAHLFVGADWFTFDLARAT